MVNPNISKSQDPHEEILLFGDAGERVREAKREVERREKAKLQARREKDARRISRALKSTLGYLRPEMSIIEVRASGENPRNILAYLIEIRSDLWARRIGSYRCCCVQCVSIWDKHMDTWGYNHSILINDDGMISGEYYVDSSINKPFMTNAHKIFDLHSGVFMADRYDSVEVQAVLQSLEAIRSKRHLLRRQYRYR